MKYGKCSFLSWKQQISWLFIFFYWEKAKITNTKKAHVCLCQSYLCSLDFMLFKTSFGHIRDTWAMTLESLSSGFLFSNHWRYRSICMSAQYDRSLLICSHLEALSQQKPFTPVKALIRLLIQQLLKHTFLFFFLFLWHTCSSYYINSE